MTAKKRSSCGRAPGKRVGAGQLWAGTPAKYVRDIKPDEAEALAETAPHYVRLGHEYLDMEEPAAAGDDVVVG